ncbi:MAG: NAD(P)-dependent oxidoreductase, partial [Armatimonadota bacterium]|nr:NAD(P)-dependent oxidoreductase [Armatimonadota bacterium]
LDELFERSDYVTVHAPMLPETEKMIGRSQLQRMKLGAVMVNTSRGRVIDSEALLEVLRAGRIYALLDVTDPEPLPADSPFRQLPNCFITPHISGAGHYGYFQIGATTRQAIEDLFAGRTPKGLVPLEIYSRIA